MLCTIKCIFLEMSEHNHESSYVSRVLSIILRNFLYRSGNIFNCKYELHTILAMHTLVRHCSFLLKVRIRQFTYILFDCLGVYSIQNYERVIIIFIIFTHKFKQMSYNAKREYDFSKSTN